MKKFLLIIFLLLALFFSPIVYAIPQPVGIGGQIKINGTAANGITVTIKNLNTAETHITATTTNQNGQLGFYAVVIDCLNNDVIKLSVTYNGNTYSNTGVVDFSSPTLWINLSITASKPQDDGDGNDNPSPEPSGNYPPIADFTYSPEKIYAKSTVIFRDNSTDIDNDIISWTWTMEDYVLTTKMISYLFQSPGYYTITLVVSDINRTMSVKQKTIHVLPVANEPEINRTNITVYIQIKDDNDIPLKNTYIEIYEDTILVDTAYTDSNGIAALDILQGTYTIQAKYYNYSGFRTYTFMNNEDALIIYLMTDNFVPPTYETIGHGGLNWFLIGLILFIVIMLCIIGILWIKK